MGHVTKTECSERHRMIAVAVLKGMTMKDAGIKYGVSTAAASRACAALGVTKSSTFERVLRLEEMLERVMADGRTMIGGVWKSKAQEALYSEAQHLLNEATP